MNLPAMTTLRDGTRNRDLAILDSLELLEAGLVPGWCSRDGLMSRWRISQSQVSRRLAGVHRLGIVLVASEYGRYHLRRSWCDDDRLWREATRQRRAHAERAARWEQLRNTQTLVPLIIETRCVAVDQPT